MTWNIRYQNATDDARGCGWKVRRQPLCALINQQVPDIVAIQEGDAPQIDDLRAVLSPYKMAGVGRDDGLRAGEFCAIFTRAERFELKTQRTRWFSPTPEVPSRGWGACCLRIVTIARLFDHQTQREFEVWNAHLDSASALARLESARQMRRAIEQLDVPVIVCGDFNSAPDDAPLAILTKNNVLRDSRLHSALQPKGPYATVCGFANFTDQIEAPLSGENARIDYILTSSHWKIENYLVLPTDQNPLPVSDHRPVVVELT